MILSLPHRLLAQLRNDSTHNVGVYLRFKKDPPASPAPFSVLPPGEETDDDFDLVALYVPAAPGPRLASVVAGQQVRLSDPAPDPADPAAQSPAYGLDLPLLDLLAGKAATSISAAPPKSSTSASRR